MKPFIPELTTIGSRLAHTTAQRLWQKRWMFLLRICQSMKKKDVMTMLGHCTALLIAWPWKITLNHLSIMFPNANTVRFIITMIWQVKEKAIWFMILIISHQSAIILYLCMVMIVLRMFIQEYITTEHFVSLRIVTPMQWFHVWQVLFQIFGLWICAIFRRILFHSCNRRASRTWYLQCQHSVQLVSIICIWTNCCINNQKRKWTGCYRNYVTLLTAGRFCKSEKNCFVSSKHRKITAFRWELLCWAVQPQMILYPCWSCFSEIGGLYPNSGSLSMHSTGRMLCLKMPHWKNFRRNWFSFIRQAEISSIFPPFRIPPKFAGKNWKRYILIFRRCGNA